MNRVTKTIAFALLTTFGFSTLAFGQSKAELKQQFKERLKDVNRLKAEGLVGETWEGWLAPVKGADLNKKQQKILDEENDDRRILYRIFAEEERTTPDLVAERNAVRNRKNLRPGEWFLTKDGDWEQKKRQK